ncbi:MAG: COG3650 family protein [Caulobacteraceae bacterium]
MKRAVVTCCLVGLGLTLGACDQLGMKPPPAPANGDTPSAPGEPASAPAASGAAWFAPIDLTGTEPFWAVNIRREGITLTGADRPKLTTANSGPVTGSGRATWDSPVAGGALNIVLEEQNCSDGMSDRTYPYTATVKVGQEVLKGCGAPENYFKTSPKP